jgi:nuclear transport factor 2 (NTF2) superfamily protein
MGESPGLPSHLPPFTRQTAMLKVRAVEDSWNPRDPERVAQCYSPLFLARPGWVFARPRGDYRFSQ